jgi:hypothetical protein
MREEISFNKGFAIGMDLSGHMGDRSRRGNRGALNKTVFFFKVSNFP